MFEVKIDGSIPQIKEDALERAMEVCSRIMGKSVRINLTVGGRPKWPPRLAGSFRTPVVATLGGITGRIGRSIKETFGKDWAEVSALATIHQRGGTIQHPGVGRTAVGMRTKSGRLKFGSVPVLSGRKLMVFIVEGKLIFTYSIVPHLIRIPRREYLMLQDEDISEIHRQVPTAIVREVTYEPINRR